MYWTIHYNGAFENLSSIIYTNLIYVREIMSSKANHSQGLVPSLDRAFEILDYITINTQAMTAAEIAKKLALPRSSVYNILQSMLQKGVLFKDAENRFYLGSYLLYWAGKFEDQQGVIKLFKELIHYHTSLLEYTVTLSTLDRQTGDVVFLDCYTSPSPLGFNFRAGVRVPAIFSASGKAMVSTLSMSEIKAMYNEGLPTPLTASGVNDYANLQKEIDSIKSCRISLDNGQLREGMFCIGTYIRNKSGRAIAGIAVSFLKTEYEAKQAEVAPALIALAEQIERRLGVVIKRPEDHGF